jgi:3-deoxy-7-phosphoheptulonate synthase
MGLNGAPNKINTTGNDTAHVILRGDNNGPNYSSESVRRTIEILRMRNLVEAILIDASHGNSRKDADKQVEVVSGVSYQIAMGQQAIKGVMIESNLVGGAQAFNPGQELLFGQSITDTCSDIPATRKMLEMLAESVQCRRELAKVTP